MVLPDLSDIPEPDYESLKVISREEWEALPSKETGEDEKLKTPVTSIILTHTDTEYCKKKDECQKIVQELQKKHMEELGLSDIRYNYVFGGDGHIYQGRGYEIKPPEHSSCPELYDKSLEMAFIGNFDETPLTWEYTSPAYDIIQVLIRMDIVHKDFVFTRLVKFKKKEESPPTTK